MRIFVLCMAAALLIGCGQDEEEPKTGSDTQNRFLDVRGKPQMYAVTFQDERVVDGEVVALDRVRRVESWTWVGATSTEARFDNGYFDSEEQIDVGITSAPTPAWSPLEFRSDMTVAQVRALVEGAGVTGTEESGDFGGATMTMLTYPGQLALMPRTFGFLDGKLTSVVVGFAFDASGVMP